MKPELKPIQNKDIINVPCAKIFADEKLNRDMQQHCKDVLLAAKNRKDGHQYDEVGRLVDIFNKYNKLDMMGCWDDKIKTCIIRTDTFEYECMVTESRELTLMFIHNHPNNSEISYGDIMQLLLDTSIKGVIAIGNTENTYYLIKEDSNRKCGYSKLYMKINNYLRNIKDKDKRSYIRDRIAKYILDNSKSFGLDYGVSKRRVIL